MLAVRAYFCGFRNAFARNFADTYFAPPPATVYGMLLSLVGETRVLRHAGAEVAVGVLCEGDAPHKAVVMRKAWRFKSGRVPGVGNNVCPDYREVYPVLDLVVGVRRGAREGTGRCLAARVLEGLAHPERVRRYGGLSLGESNGLVDEVRVWDGHCAFAEGWLLCRAEGGEVDMSLPVWADHVGSRFTRWQPVRRRKIAVCDVERALAGDLPWMAVTPV